MLMSAGGRALPRKVFGHGFVYRKNEETGEVQKLSKSLGNVVEPTQVYKDPRPAEHFDRFHERARTREPDAVYEFVRVSTTLYGLVALRLRIDLRGEGARSTAPSSSRRTTPRSSTTSSSAPRCAARCGSWRSPSCSRRRCRRSSRTAVCSRSGAATATRRRSSRRCRSSHDGGCVAMYCEAGRSRTGRSASRAKPGIGRLALESGAMIVPVAVHGSSRVRNWRRLQFPTVTVQYGEPFRYARVEEPTRDQQQAVADEILERDPRPLRRPRAGSAGPPRWRVRAPNGARGAPSGPLRVRRWAPGARRASCPPCAARSLWPSPSGGRAGGARAPVTLAKIGDFAAPDYVTAPPGDTSRVFVVEQGGTSRCSTAPQPAPFLDITRRRDVGRTASAACSRWPSRSTTRRAACSTSTTRRRARSGRSR